MAKALYALPLALAAVGCSEAGNQPKDLKSFDVAESAATEAAADAAGEGAAPRIGANVAPGVAFEHHHQFALPEARIGETQSRHAAQCEALGIVRCRVTGMTFEKADGGEVEATLAFKLDPALAYGFARDAADIVEAADGRLADSRITGEDAGSAIVGDDKSLAGIDTELAKIEAQLKIPNLSKDVRGRLVEEAQRLRAERKEIAVGRDGKVESLATTPVTFDYASSDAVMGFDNASPIGRAARTAGASFSAMIEVVLTVFGALAPWALLGGAVFWIVRRLRPKKVID
jgi:hypothetical protein